ncbi:hypothetical protein [Nonomuraea soli]|uniref:Uncharacterized protein n=1 Tax=Nonomuraea soli TaxID=1032476 RepID=A0A7W0CMY7_9ACTN|nr:hypothetical protein [Nonomuraea soli]MBA2894154.1 hypothetical protein [Nonomuraea soli]
MRSLSRYPYGVAAAVVSGVYLLVVLLSALLALTPGELSGVLLIIVTEPLGSLALASPLTEGNGPLATAALVAAGLLQAWLMWVVVRGPAGAVPVALPATARALRWVLYVYAGGQIFGRMVGLFLPPVYWIAEALGVVAAILVYLVLDRAPRWLRLIVLALGLLWLVPGATLILPGLAVPDWTVVITALWWPAVGLLQVWERRWTALTSVLAIAGGVAAVLLGLLPDDPASSIAWANQLLGAVTTLAVAAWAVRTAHETGLR